VVAASSTTTAQPGDQFDLVVGVRKAGRSWAEVAVIEDLRDSGAAGHSDYLLLVGLQKAIKTRIGGVYRVSVRNVSSSARTCEKDTCWTDYVEVISATRMTGRCQDTTYRRKNRFHPDTRLRATVCINAYGVQAFMSNRFYSANIRRVDLVVERFTLGTTVVVSSPMQVNFAFGPVNRIITVSDPQIVARCSARITGLIDIDSDGKDLLPAGTKTFRC
jgi:hypothetical protein